MNYKFISKGLAIAAFLSIAFSACKKETVNVVTDDSAKYSEQAMIDDADNRYNSDIIIEGSETTEFSAEFEGLPEEYTLTEIDMDEAGFKRGIEKRFLMCLKKLDLTDSQVMKLRMAMRAYEECKGADIRNHREAFIKLHLRIEAARKELLYKLHNQKISKADFEAAMKVLRADFIESLRKIKLNHSKHLKECYDKFLRHVKLTLTERQWKAFVDCYR